MSRKREVAMMNYNLCEELISSISHGVGAGLAIAATVLCIVRSAHLGNPWAIVSCSIFGFTLIMLYCMSTIYHALPRGKAKKVFRVIDHCTVFLLIAGTYTPCMLVHFHNAKGWIMFGIIWGLAVLGIIFNAIDVDKYETVSAVINVIMGWAVCFMFGDLIAAIGTGGVVLLIAGGASYTIGAILYGLGEKIRYMHSIFHFFCLGGSICHFLAIYNYVL
ncbi:MAG: hemolysin III family protein [Lachnospiraceae bacterium]|nr:hemolysin III family protein [Lachnospiraceae bacterium]